MAKVRMRALKTFRVSELKTGVTPGVEFEVSDVTADGYEKRGMAVRLASGLRSAARAPASNTAAVDGPLPSRGGRPGAAKRVSLPRAGKAPGRRRSKK